MVAGTACYIRAVCGFRRRGNSAKVRQILMTGNQDKSPYKEVNGGQIGNLVPSGQVDAQSDTTE